MKITFHNFRIEKFFSKYKTQKPQKIDKIRLRKTWNIYAGKKRKQKKKMQSISKTINYKDQSSLSTYTE